MGRSSEVAPALESRRLTPALGRCAYFVVAEALTNATKHAAAGQISVGSSSPTATGRPLLGVVRTVNRSVRAPRATATIALRGVAPGAHVGAHVIVSIDAQSSAARTLAVPIGALYASGDGSAYVILAGRRLQRVPVNVGQAVGGYVPIVNPSTQLLPGTQLVLDSSQAASGGFGGP